MITYFVSQYLNVIDLETSTLLFNGANGVMDEVGNALGDKLRAPRTPVDLSDMSESEIRYLKKRGHITPLSQEEEVETLKHIARSLHQQDQKSAKGEGHIMFLLSYNCNLDCHYCYQRQIRRRDRKSHHAQVMSPAFVEELFTQHFKTLFPGVPYHRVSITLYGGEPFLPRHTQAIAKILELAHQTPVQNIGAVTNGTQIETMLDFFGPLPDQVTNVQITLDGAQESHDQSRIPPSKTPTFQKIIANVHRLLEKKVRVNLRINISPESIHQLDRLAEFLEKQELLAHPLVYSYVNPISIHYDQTDEEGLLSVAEVSNYLTNSPISKQLRTPAGRRADHFRYLLSRQKGVTGLTRSSFCMISTENEVVVDPYGDIYKCYDEAGREEYKVGEIREGQIKWFEPVLKAYLSRNISTMEQCSTCSVALACGGECAALAKAKYHDYFTPYCNDVKSVFLDAIKSLYQERTMDMKQNNIDINHPYL